MAPLPPRSLGAFRRALLDWFDTHRRPLPWRDVDDPYKVWVSEIMLQQTRVETVRSYYERWLERFPDVHSLAAAPADDVLRLWSGLGYYTRARNLHKAAKTVAKEHDGKVPADLHELQRLPGIGPYSAGAIASIAHRVPAPAVDGNALRVLSRLTGEQEPIEKGPVKRRLTEEADRLVDPERPGDWNQAVMELGATHCNPRRPDCGACPVARWCTAHREHLTEKIPRTKAKRPVTEQEVHFALIERNGKILLAKRPEDALLGGTWGLPGGSLHEPLGRIVREQTGLRVRKGKQLGEAEHRFTHRHWRMRVYACTPTNGSRDTHGTHSTHSTQGANGTQHTGTPTPTDPGLHWVPLEELDGAPLAKATRKAIAACGLRAPVRS